MNSRKFHRWLGVPAAVFLLVVSFTGVWLECEKFFGPEEAERERLRDLPTTSATENRAGEFAAEFQSNLAAATARVGGQPLEKVVWQLKGDAPTVTFYFSPKGKTEGRRITVNARSHRVLREAAYEEDSFILRLHSGEALGDGGQVLGMFWGAALFALTVSGMVIYFRMKPRKPQTGIRKIFWTLAFLMGGALVSARADSPFFTDDPLFSPGWEIKLGVGAEHNVGGNAVAGPILDINYAVVPTVRLDVTFAYLSASPKNELGANGFGTTDFKVKWRFLEEDPHGWRPALSIAPKVTLPTAGTALSDGVWRAQFPIELGKTLGNWYHFAEAGYQWAFDDAATDVAFWGVGSLYNFDKHLAAGVEIYGLVPVEEQKAHVLAATLGAVYTFDAHWSMKASVSQSLREENQPGPRPAGVFYVVWNF